MDARQWLEQVRAQLVLRKLPPRYVARLVSELSDHVTDLMEDPMCMDACDLREAVRPMGAPTDIADSAANEYRKVRFAGRHPVIAFVGLPVVVLPLLWIGTIMAFVLIAKLAGFGEGGEMTIEHLPVWLGRSLATLIFGMVLVPIGLAALFFCRLARKAQIGRKWPLVACLVLGVIGGMAFFDVALPGANQKGLLHDTKFSSEVLDQNTRHGAVTMGFGFGLGMYPKWWQIVQFFVPVAIGGVFVWRQLAAGRRSFAT